MKQPILQTLVTIVTINSSSVTASPFTSIQDASKSLINTIRRPLNLSNVFGSATSLEPYERIASQPVFTVTTPWGSPYLLFERTDRTETFLEFDEEEPASAGPNGGAGAKQDNTKQVALYFMDEEDAMKLRDEMLQMDQMSGADMRITASSLSKAISQSTNLHKGLLTGQPIDEHTGKMKGPNEGGVLRYKIVPPRRELFYAARCKGKERVGLWNANPEDDARLMMQNIPVIGGTLAVMRKSAYEKRKREMKAVSTTGAAGAAAGVADENTDGIRHEYRHMEGFVGIPVFHCPGLQKYNKVKGILRNERKKQTPLYFSYEDLVDSYSAMRSAAKDPSAIPEKPDVEVYNLMDVVTSIDKDQWRKKRTNQLQRNALLGKIPIVNKITGTEGSATSKIAGTQTSGLDQIVFVPNSKNTQFKESITKGGNGQARGLRPMRPWGKDMM